MWEEQEEGGGREEEKNCTGLRERTPSPRAKTNNRLCHRQDSREQINQKGAIRAITSPHNYTHKQTQWGMRGHTQLRGDT